MVPVSGLVEPGFGHLADALARNLSDGLDLGAACSVMIDGKVVVDIVGGEARPGVPWTTDTRCIVFSVSKGITTICLLMAAEKGLLDLDRPVSVYWPEFAAHQKGEITVRQMLAHRAGLVAPTAHLSAQDMIEWHPVTEALEDQEPLWKPNSTFFYHPLTFGYLAGEVLRRTTGMLPSQWLARYISGPLGLKMTYGASIDDPTLAAVVPPSAPTEPTGLVWQKTDSQKFFEELDRRAVSMGGAFSTDLFEAANTPEVLNSESPAVNLVASAHDLARAYSATVCDTEGVRLLQPDTIYRATEPISYGTDFRGEESGSVWGTGFMLYNWRRKMAGPGSFGHDGAAGQIAFAHPELNLSFAYQTNTVGTPFEERAEALSGALRTCLR